MRPPIQFLILAAVAAALTVGGCAVIRPAPGPVTPIGDGPSVPAPAKDDETPNGLVEAQGEYFAGVRAYVEGDLIQSERHFHRVEEILAFAGSESVADVAAHDAVTLLTKSDYFLGKITDVLYDGVAPAAGTVAMPETTPATWNVVHGEIRPVQNKDVDRWLHYFQNDGREIFQRWLDRKPRYETIFHEAFERHGLPREIEFHAMIESGFSPNAYSWAHAVGVWQFVRATGRRYGLRSDWWVDERRDPVAATEAATRYLVDLYEEFQNWELALAAYNVGEGRIRKQIRRQNTRDFWKLRLPRETRNHIPKFYAALILGSNPEAYGFLPGTQTLPEYETVAVDFCVDFDVLSDCCGATPRLLAELNPALVRRCTPPDEKDFLVRVPLGTGEATRIALAAVPEDQRVRWIHHRVRRGETLSHIADNYRTTVSAIAEANRLRSRNFLSIGQELIIPQGRRSGANPPRLASSTPSSSGRKVSYTVRKGDTLSEIAERHRVSTGKMRKWNRLGKFIYPGQRLTIYSNGARSSRSTSVVKVRRGDTLWDIARLHGVPLTSLLHANDLRRNAVIRPGDMLKIPRS